MTFKVLFVFVVLAHHRRRVVHFNVTDAPRPAWTAQQLVEAFPWDTAPCYLLRDRALRGRVLESCTLPGDIRSSVRRTNGPRPFLRAPGRANRKGQVAGHHPMSDPPVCSARQAATWTARPGVRSQAVRRRWSVLPSDARHPSLTRVGGLIDQEALIRRHSLEVGAP